MTMWDDWRATLPASLPDQQKYTATLLVTLGRILETAPFPWALVGGTAMQAYLPSELRRYSTDIEIITPAAAHVVERWMTSQGWNASPYMANMLTTPLHPEGTLAVIHDYPATGFKAVEPEPVPFRHFPIPKNQPPATLTIPMASFPFLVAAKIWEIRRPDRGGERNKDAHDLAVTLGRVDGTKLSSALAAYHDIRGDLNPIQETYRAAGVWLQRFSGPLHERFKDWQSGFVEKPDMVATLAELKKALTILEGLCGEAIIARPEEDVRVALSMATPKQLAPIAQALGFREVTKNEKMRDFLAAQAKTNGIAEADSGLLLARLRKLGGLPSL